MANEEVARIFERMARVLAFKEADRFRILAYERAAGSVREAEDVAVLAREGRLKDIPGVGEDLSSMIEEFVRTGRIRRYEQERRGISEELIDLMGVPGLGPKTLSLLHRRLKINGIEDLKRAIDSGALLRVPGFREKKVENIAHAMQLWAGAQERMPLGVALPLAEHLIDDVRHVAQVEKADVAGSLRRRRETIGDLDFLIVSGDSPAALRAISKLPMVKRVLALGDTKATLLIEGPVQVDVRAVEKAAYGAALLYFTGSKDHNVHLRTLARGRGWKINEYGVFQDSKRLGGASEDEVYRMLGLPTIPPEIREDRGEIEAAQKHKLPKLIEPDDLQGEFHAHTEYSDGRNTVAEMVEQAAQLGYRYIGLADHSPAARIAHGLDQERLEQKIEEVERLRKSRGRRAPEILMAAEVDILSDGKLDYPDGVLKRLDVVIGAIHAGFKQTPDRMTGRILDALDCPWIHVLGHPTGRLMGSREPIQFDFEKVIGRALERKVAMEINGSWQRLDLNDTMARTAQEAGVLLAIGSDAHSTAQMEGIRYGVFQARRGWIEARNVVNTWPLAKVRRWLAR
jgi:DNA polymerase (family 10)